MFGFLFGAAAVATLFYVKHRRRGYARHGACHGGCGHSHWGRHRRWGGEGHDAWGASHGGSSPFWLRGVFARLDTTPGQEKVIREVFDEMRAHGRDLGAEFERARTDVADALRADTIDATALGEAFGRHDDALDRMRKAGIGALAKLHEALDERQRRLLAQWIESRRSGGPYRDAPGFA